MTETLSPTVADDLFRFIAVREPDRALSVLPQVPTWTPTLTTHGYPTGTKVPTGRPTIMSMEEAPILIRGLDRYLNGHRGTLLLLDELLTYIRQTWWRIKNPDTATEPPPQRLPTIPQIVEDPLLGDDYRRCAESLLAATYGTQAGEATRPDLMRVMQLFGLLRFLAIHPDMSSSAVHRVVEDCQILIPGDAVPTPPVEPAPALQQALPPVEDLSTKRAALLARVDRLNQAADDLAAFLARPPLVGIDYAGSAPWVLAPLRRGHLSSQTTTLLAEEGIGDWKSIFEIVDQLRTKAGDAFTEAILPSPDEEKARRQAELVAELARARGHTLMAGDNQAFVTPSGAVLARPPRVGDLEIVRQQFVCYEKGEVAHVENVLAKEKRERTHRMVDLTETETTEVEETEEERSWDNQTTTRDELAKETSNVISENTQFQAGVQVAARYGPYVEVNANVGFAKSSSTQDSERNARTFAKDVTERAAGRVRTRVMETRRRLTRREVTEQTVHGFNNTGPGATNIVGFYRWLNKRYLAQMFNLGRRLMLELVIPDPAINFRYASAKGAGLDVDVEPAPPFTSPNSDLKLRPDHVTPWTWKALTTLFRAEGVDPPPAEFITITNALSAVGQDPKPYASTPPVEFNVSAFYKDDQKLQIPAGYQPVMWTAVVLSGDRVTWKIGSSPEFTVILAGPTANGHIAVGPSATKTSGGADQIFGTFDWGATSPYGLPPVAPAGEKGAMLPVALYLLGPPGYTATITVLCRRSPVALEKWQMATWDAIVASHGSWERAYRDAVRSAEIGRGVTISGLNPLENQMVIRGELKRSAIQMLGGPAPASLIATKPGAPAQGKPPEMNVHAAAAVGSEVLFWEQSFEWENLTYLFYPYFWTGRDDWPEQSRLDDADPLFAEFLRSGAARVVVPVRPGFESPVALRLAVTLPKGWLSSPAPIVAKEPWLSVAEELRARQDDTTGKPVGKPWPVVLPTTLVMLDDGDDLFGCSNGQGTRRQLDAIGGQG